MMSRVSVIRPPLLVVWFVLFVSSVSLLPGCASTLVYPNTLLKNIEIHSKTSSGSILTGVSTTLDIYSIKGGCDTKYKGTIRLPDKLTLVGLPVNTQSYLVFNFNIIGLSPNSSSTFQSTVLTPKAGHKYVIEVTYEDDMHYVGITEMKGQRKIREIETRQEACVK